MDAAQQLEALTHQLDAVRVLIVAMMLGCLALAAMVKVPEEPEAKKAQSRLQRDHILGAHKQFPEAACKLCWP